MRATCTYQRRFTECSTGYFENVRDVCDRFQIEESDLKGCKILFAAYDHEYEGQALVVFRRNRKLYEVNGSHCSCYGLEGQWEPEQTSAEALLHRIEKGSLGYFLDSFASELRSVLEGLSRKRQDQAA